MKHRVSDLPSLISRYVLRRDNNVFISPIDLRHIRRYVFAAEQMVSGSVLDLACGAGYGSELLAERTTKYLGVDYAAYCIRYAEANYGKEGRNFLNCSVFDLSSRVPDQKFDNVVSFETIEHVDDPHRMLETLLDRLAPGGRLILSVPLNHPDIIYHRAVYKYSDVKALFRPYVDISSKRLSEFRQSNLEIAPITSALEESATGTWIGVLQDAASA